MKLLKKIACLVLSCAVLTTGMSSIQVKAVTKNGFTYNASQYSSVVWKSQGNTKVYSSGDGLLGTLTYTVDVARYKSTNDYITMVKMVMTPYNSKVKVNQYWYGYGFSEYVSVSTIVPGALNDYKPKNDPSSNTVNLSLGYSKDGASIGASYDIVHKELDITAKCDTPKKKYYVVYDYKPNIVLVAASNKYVANESEQYGMAQFETSSKTQKITYNFDARFGAAEDNAASPLNIYLNDVFKQTKAVTHTFSF